MKHVMLFEEFNPYTGKAFAEKLRIYALASEVSKKVSEIRLKDEDFSFEVYTNLPNEAPQGTKSFYVYIPMDKVSTVRVDTYENDKKTFSTNLEPKGENDINNILMNFIESLNLYDDSSIERIVDEYKNIKTPDDIKRILQRPDIAE